MKFSASSDMYYTRPSADWNEALPVGNGRMGAMVFGIPGAELIQLNEDSVWSGGFRNRNNPKAYDNLERIRGLIRDGDIPGAEALCADSFFGTNDNQRHYQPLGDLHIWHIWQAAGEYTDYCRGLSLDRAVSWVRFTAGDITFTREVFASHPDEVIVIRFTADKKGAVSFTAAIDGRDDNYDKNEAYGGDTLLFTVSDGIPYACAVTVKAWGGEYGTEANRLFCKNADEAVIIIGAQTSWRTGDYEKLCVSQTRRAARMLPEELMSRHIADYESLYRRCSLFIYPEENADTDIPTDERLEAVRDNNTADNELAAMYFNFSRYLMISGSRQGTLPLNLQGIWNKDMWPAWGSKYTVNINTEMNYWGAEIQNLSECHLPLFDHIERMRENGRITARAMYGCGGTVCHHNTDIWGDTAPQDRWMPATLWPMGMAWLCTHIWEHYLFTCDKDFLSDKYDAMREAAEFFTDFLIEDDKGRLVTCPSVSPENTYRTAGGAEGNLCTSPSMDSQILHQLFTAVISASEILDRDKEFADKLRAMRERLPKPEVGQYGQIMEWAEDYGEVEPGHRHISQLYALYPADIITTTGTPGLAAAARATIERRLSHGGGHTGWSRAWIINMWARLGDGERVWENIQALLGKSTSINMFDMHPPFQIDGNFGGGAGIAEALLQSSGGEISFLPALPSRWKHGSVRGMKARGGFTVHFDWSEGRLTRGEIISEAGNSVSLRINGEPRIICGGEEITPVLGDNGAYSFDTEKGKRYSITLR